MAEQVKRSELVEVTNQPAKITLKGVEYAIEPLTYNDLAELETALGSINDLDVTKFGHMRFVLYLALRKADPNLPATDKRRGNYRMTEREVGNMFTLKDISDPEVSEFIRQLLIMSGLIAETAEGDAEGNEEPESPSDMADSGS